MKFVEMNKAVNVLHPSGSSRAWTLRKVREAEKRRHAYHDQASELQTASWDTVRQALSGKHLRRATLALDEALRRVAVGDHADPWTPERASLDFF